MYHPFTIGETISAAWDILKKNFITIVVYSTIAVVFIVLVAFLNESINTEQNFLISALLYLLILCIQGYTTLGLYKLIFTLMDSEYYEFEVSQVLPRFRLIVNFIALSLLVGIAVFIYQAIILGVLLDNYILAQNIVKTIGSLVTIYLALRCMFCLCFIADEHSGPVESLVQSFRLTRGHLLQILGILFIIILLIAIPALIAKALAAPVIFGVLIIVTYPFVNIILATTYRKLVYSNKDVDDDVSETL